MKTRLVLTLFSLAALAFGQATAQRQMSVSESGPAFKPEPKPKPTAEHLERGRQMLETAEAQAMGLEGGMRAYGLLQIARAYQSSDRKKALKLLEDALTATRAIDDDKLDTRKRLQEQILQTMVPLAPRRADELLTQVAPEARGTVLRSLLSYYQEQKDTDRAIEVLYRVAQEVEMPYEAAMSLMSGLPPERSADAVHIFNAALASFRDHADENRRGINIGGGDFATLVVRNWSRLPKEAVLEAISEILKKAKANDESGNISMASAKGAVAFNSMYEYRLFQVLPVLKQLDESGAKKLLEEHQQVQAQLARYPQGMDSVNPPEDGKQGGMGGTSFMVNSGGGPGPSGPPRGPGPGMSPLDMQRASKISADAQAHPRDALANAATISDPQLRANTLMAIARSAWKENSSVAREALQKALDLVPQLQNIAQLSVVSTAGRLYLQMGETEEAKKTVERGLDVGDKMLKDDSNADDPNKALKAYWPSAEAYRSMLRLAVRISPAWAQERAAEISDPEMKVIAQIAMAGSLLDVPAGSTTIMSDSKKGSNISISTER